MAKLIFDAIGERQYEMGVSQVVLYPQDASGAYPKGYAWNGISNISDSPDGADVNEIWADNIKYATFRAVENSKGSIEAYMYPDEWMQCDGYVELEEGIVIGQQNRAAFGLCYRTEVGNDTASNADGDYKLHLVYGATASPSEQSHDTVNDSPDAQTFSWDYDCVPVSVAGHKPTATMTITASKVGETKMKKLLDALYGTESTEAHLPLPDEILTLLKG